MHNNAIKENWGSTQLDFLAEQLANHPLYSAINSKHNLKVFMEHHVYAVWDFMSLIKAMQFHIAPTTVPWIPPKNSHFANYINQLVLEEESDRELVKDTNRTATSHFESYVGAMKEVGGNTFLITNFINSINDKGLDLALDNEYIPAPAKQFMAFTFDIINQNQLHLLASALAYGREVLVPLLFRSLQQGIQINQKDAPNLYAYLNRHIQLDEQEHGPIVMRMLQDLCAGSDIKKAESLEVAELALVTRLNFWDGIYQAITK